MYSYSTSCVKINDKLTEFFATKLGVKQGDNLSPNLFKIFINDLPSYLSNTKDPVILDNSPCMLMTLSYYPNQQKEYKKN